MIWWYNPLAFHSHFIMHGPAIDIDWMRLDGDGHMESASRSSSDRRSSRATFVMKQLRSRRSLSHRSDLRDVKSSHPTSNDRRKHTRTRSYSVALIIWNLSHPHQTAVFLVRFEITQKNWRLMFRGAIHFSKKISDGTCYGCQRPLCEVESPFCLWELSLFMVHDEIV